MNCDQCDGEGWVNCSRCAGAGFNDSDSPWCTPCNGDGAIDCPKCDGSGWSDVKPTDCAGTGEVDVYNGESANDPVANGCTDALTLMDDEQRAATELYLEHRAEEVRQGLSKLPFEFDPERLTLISAGIYLDDGLLPLGDEPQSAERLVLFNRFNPDGQWGAEDLSLTLELDVTSAQELGEKMLDFIERWGEDGDDG